MIQMLSCYVHVVSTEYLEPDDDAVDECKLF